MTMIKSYSELIKIDDFLERYNYLKLTGVVGERTFGFTRYLNQSLYQSPKWKKVRRNVILRDNGCDMGLIGYPLSKALIHHINPITLKELENDDAAIFDEDNLITVSHLTHNAIHYGDANLLPHPLIVRRPNDTILWRRLNE